MRTTTSCYKIVPAAFVAVASAPAVFVAVESAPAAFAAVECARAAFAAVVSAPAVASAAALVPAVASAPVVFAAVTVAVYVVLSCHNASVCRCGSLRAIGRDRACLPATATANTVRPLQVPARQAVVSGRVRQ